MDIDLLVFNAQKVRVELVTVLIMYFEVLIIFIAENKWKIIYLRGKV